MTNEEAVQLCAEAQEGDGGARDRLVLAHMPLMKLVAKDWVAVLRSSTRDYGLGFADVVGEAIEIMLGEVVPQFRPDRGMKFRSFARLKMNAGLWRRVKKKVRRFKLIERAGYHLREEALDRSEGRSPESIYGDRELTSSVERLLERAEDLTPEMRDVMRLSAGGMSGRAIAAALDIQPPKRVYDLIREARVILRKELDHDE